MSGNGLVSASASAAGRSVRLDLAAPLLIGFGITGQAVARALLARGHRPVVVEDRPNDGHRTAASTLGVALVESPDRDELARLVQAATVLLPSPGVPDHHPVFAAAQRAGLAMASEFDLAQAWDDRPMAAITGTNGKTTVTMMVTDALERSGLTAEAVGNTDVPVVEAIDREETRVFVVEASSFRLGHSAGFRPDIAAWLNFAPDHLDAHASLEHYEAAKASIWSRLRGVGVAVVGIDDPVVRRHRPVPEIDGGPEGVREVRTFGVDPAADWRIEGGSLVGPDGPLVAVEELARRQPHDLSNALATAAIATAAGASAEAVADALRAFRGLPHRLELLGSRDGVTWYNDSKATVPQATVAAVGGFDSVVLIAGGRGKGLSFDVLRSTVPPVRAVVAIGEAAGDVAAVFGDLVPVRSADSMSAAIAEARSVAAPGDAVVLSPACASFDWYPNYVERGLDFRRLVTEEVDPR